MQRIPLHEHGYQRTTKKGPFHGVCKIQVLRVTDPRCHDFKGTFGQSKLSLEETHGCQPDCHIVVVDSSGEQIEVLKCSSGISRGRMRACAASFRVFLSSSSLISDSITVSQIISFSFSFQRQRLHLA